MYPGKYAARQPDHPAVIMAQTGAVLTYGELEARSNRLAHLLRARGLHRLDHYAIFMENNAHYVECCSAGTRTGLYYTCVNSFLTPEELAYILNNSESKILITSEAKRGVALAALKSCLKVELCLIGDGEGERERCKTSIRRPRGFPRRRSPTRAWASPCSLFRHHGQAERNFAAAPAAAAFPAFPALRLSRQALALPRRRDLSLAGAALSFGAAGGGQPHHRPRRHRNHHGDLRRRALSRADPALPGTHSQLVPTMFSRMLKLPEAVRRRYDLSSLETAVHAAAPCPVQVKER